MKPKDEVIILFNDMCLDAWWQSGGQQTQVETRRHDLSDASCFLGITSVPRAVTEYSTNSVMLRNEDKDSYFEIVDDQKTINIVGAEKINVTAVDDITVNTAANITINAQGTMAINSVGAMTINSDTSIVMTAPRIDLNP